MSDSTLPPSVGALLDALSTGGPRSAAGSLAPGAVIALLPSGEETSPRVLVPEGADRASLLSLGVLVGSDREVRIAAIDGHHVLVEGTAVWHGQERPGTFVASARLDAQGLIERFVEFGCREDVCFAPSTGGIDARTSAPRLVDRYFHELDSADFLNAAACFSSGTLYSHPPYKHTGITDPGRIQFDGRAALLAGFERRGAQSFAHEIVAMAHVGQHCIFEGRVPGLPDGRVGGFVSSLSLDGAGLMERYVSFYAEPAVPLS